MGMNMEKKPIIPRRKGGRPKGSKSKLAFITFPEAIEHAKLLWKKAGFKEMSFDDIKELTRLHQQKLVRVLGALSGKYGVIEKTDAGYWRLTDAGQRVGKDDPTGLKQVFQKDTMFAELYSKWGDKEVTPGVIRDYVERNFKGVNAKEVTKRFQQGKNIIREHTSQAQKNQLGSIMGGELTLTLFQLKYALNPPSNQEIRNIVRGVVKTFAESDDRVLKLISELMEEIVAGDRELKDPDRKELAKHLDRAMNELGLNPPKAEEEKKPETA